MRMVREKSLGYSNNRRRKRTYLPQQSTRKIMKIQIFGTNLDCRSCSNHNLFTGFIAPSKCDLKAQKAIYAQEYTH
jgi:hypothetical protein